MAEKWTPFYYHEWVTLLRMVVRDNVQSRFLPSHGAFRCTARSTYETGWKCFLKRFLPVGNKQIYALYGEWNWKSLILLSLFRARTACAISKSVSRIKRGKRPCITKGSSNMVFIYLALILLIRFSLEMENFVRVLKYLRFVSGVIKHDGMEIRRIRTFPLNSSFHST